MTKKKNGGEEEISGRNGLTNFSTVNIERESQTLLEKHHIVIAGIGGAGNNIIDIISKEEIGNVHTAAVDTDFFHLADIKADTKIPIGKEITKKRGTGVSPNIGREAAKNSTNKFRDLFREADFVFLTYGLGGGTGTGGGPVIAKVAKEEKAVVKGVVTILFKVEDLDGITEQGLRDLYRYTDSAVIIDNNRLHEAAASLPVRYIFEICDQVLRRTIKYITGTIENPNLNELDFVNIEKMMKAMEIYRLNSKGKEEIEKIIEKTLNSKYIEEESDRKGCRGYYI